MHIKLAVATDSSYVHGGVSRQCLMENWISAQGPVTNIALWIELMNLIDLSKAIIVWIKVPSDT